MMARTIEFRSCRSSPPITVQCDGDFWSHHRRKIAENQMADVFYARDTIVSRWLNKRYFISISCIEKSPEELNVNKLTWITRRESIVRSQDGPDNEEVKVKEKMEWSGRSVQQRKRNWFSSVSPLMRSFLIPTVATMQFLILCARIYFKSYQV